MANTKANKVSVLIVKPAKPIKAKVPIMATGIANNGIIEARRVLKKTKITKATNKEASIKVLKTSLIERSINTELSLAISIFTPSGKSF